eukprot:scaffold334_cov241-Pinguiococcus_pyrenoidosus.AAC.62
MRLGGVPEPAAAADGLCGSEARCTAPLQLRRLRQSRAGTRLGAPPAWTSRTHATSELSQVRCDPEPGHDHGRACGTAASQHWGFGGKSAANENAPPTVSPTVYCSREAASAGLCPPSAV